MAHCPYQHPGVSWEFVKDVHVKSLIVHEEYIGSLNNLGIGRKRDMLPKSWTEIIVHIVEEPNPNAPFCFFFVATLFFNIMWSRLKHFRYFSHSRGVWNSPFISSIYLIQKQVLNEMQGSFGPSEVDSDMAMCQYLRNRVSISTCNDHEDTMIWFATLLPISLPWCM